MSYEEKGTWVYLVVTSAVYAAYVLRVMGRAVVPISETPFESTLWWALGASVVAAVVVRVVAEIITPSESYKVDSRDHEIERLSVVRTWWFLIAGAFAAMLMAMAQWPYFWIANVIFLGFVLQAVAGSVVKLVAYRRGF